MGKVKETLDDAVRLNGGDILVMQHEYVLAELARLDSLVDYIYLRMKFYYEPCSLDQIRDIHEHLGYLRKIIDRV